jgi:hypothetical protein
VDSGGRVLVAPQKIARLKFRLGSKRFVRLVAEICKITAPQRDWREFRMARIKL